jgi:hypothetical protein
MDQLLSLFRRSLNEAIVSGRFPDKDTPLGAYTVVAIRAVAIEHPAATPDLIASAYDAFLREPAR